MRLIEIVMKRKYIGWVVVVAKITVPHSVLYERLLCLFRCQMYS